MSVDVLGQNLVGLGGESNRGGVVGVVIRFNLDDGTDKSIGWRTASQGSGGVNNKPVSMFYTTDGVTPVSPTVALDDFAGTPSVGIWHTLSKNLRDEFNAQFTEDYDTNVVSYDIFLMAASRTSQVPTTHGSQGFYDNVSLTPNNLPTVTINQPADEQESHGQREDHERGESRVTAGHGRGPFRSACCPSA